MSSRLTLMLPPGLGSRKVEVDTKRFSIGRTPENDLFIDDTSLSRRHALIENYDGAFYLSDCGSSNGTFVNGRQVSGLSALSDGDLLTLGGVGDILVSIRDDAQAAQAGNQAAGMNAAPAALAPSAVASPRIVNQGLAVGADQVWLSGPVIAGAAAVVILLVAGLVLVITKGGSSTRVVTRRPPPLVESRNDQNSQVENTPNANENTANSNTGNTASSNSGDTPGQVDFSAIEGYASNVLSGISKDTRTVLTEKPLSEINAQIQRYRDSPSSLRDELRAMKRAIPQISAAAKSSGVRTPLAVYATLARIDTDGGRGEPVQVAVQMCPTLAKMRAIFGDELANDSLLSVAALEEGPSLQLRITKLAKGNDSPATIRSIWYLRDHQVISAETYNFVLRFMAIGVIAQNPQKFGIAAEPLDSLQIPSR